MPRKKDTASSVSMEDIHNMVLEIRNVIQGSALTGGKGSIAQRLESVEEVTEKVKGFDTEENHDVWKKVKLYINRIDVLTWLTASANGMGLLALMIAFGEKIQGFIEKVFAGN